MTSHPLTIDHARIRAAFPALAGDTVFLENAGGSQVPKVVADRIHAYMLETYVQLNAGYDISQQCAEVVDDAHAFISRFMNATDGTVILGSSTTALMHMLAGCYADVLQPGAEIVIAESGHESNIGPWARLERLGATVRWWRLDDSGSCGPAGLEQVLSNRTALVAFPQVSNLLGDVVDVAAITAMAHRVGARVLVDGVAFAPHRAIDVAAWDVDWYVYSTYKVYGPHMAALYGRHDAVAELTGPNHYFIPKDQLPYKFELGGPCHEGCAGLLGLGEYLNHLVGEPPQDVCTRATIERAFELMTACEQPLQERLIPWLLERPDVELVGPACTGVHERICTISFRHATKSSRDIAAAVHPSGIAIRNGNMYAYRLCQALGIDVTDGVVRVSAVHYNSPAEIERLIEALDRVL